MLKCVIKCALLVEHFTIFSTDCLNSHAKIRVFTQSGTDADRARAVAAENRVKVLEKQRAELMEGFRKQLKLIDILKRQKVSKNANRVVAVLLTVHYCAAGSCFVVADSF